MQCFLWHNACNVLWHNVYSVFHDTMCAMYSMTQWVVFSMSQCVQCFLWQTIHSVLFFVFWNELCNLFHNLPFDLMFDQCNCTLDYFIPIKYIVFWANWPLKRKLYHFFLKCALCQMTTSLHFICLRCDLVLYLSQLACSFPSFYIAQINLRFMMLSEPITSYILLCFLSQFTLTFGDAFWAN